MTVCVVVRRSSTAAIVRMIQDPRSTRLWEYGGRESLPGRITRRVRVCHRVACLAHKEGYVALFIADRRGALVRESPAPDDSGPVANPYSTVTLGVRVGGAHNKRLSLSSRSALFDGPASRAVHTRS